MSRNMARITTTIARKNFICFVFAANREFHGKLFTNKNIEDVARDEAIAASNEYVDHFVHNVSLLLCENGERTMQGQGDYLYTSSFMSTVALAHLHYG